MKKINKILIVVLVLFAFVATSLTVYAMAVNPIEEVSIKKPYKTISYEEGNWEDFRDEVLKNKKSFLDEKVKEGVLTQEKADEYYNFMLEMQEFCNDAGRFGRGMGCGFGGRGMARNWQ